MIEMVILLFLLFALSLIVFHQLTWHVESHVGCDGNRCTGDRRDFAATKRSG